MTLKSIDPSEFASRAEWLASDCRSLSWLVGYFFRREIYAHGHLAELQREAEDSSFDEGQLDNLLDIVKKRATAKAAEGRTAELPDLGPYLFGWRDLSGIDEPKAWVKEQVETDEGFLLVLEKLRTWAMSDRIYRPLLRSAVEVFFDWTQVVQRLERLSTTAFAEKAAEIVTAIEQGER